MSSTLQIKGIPQSVRKALEASAAANFRSLNQEALAIIAQHCDGTARLRVLLDEGLAGEKQPHEPGNARAVLAKVLARKRSEPGRKG